MTNFDSTLASPEFVPASDIHPLLVITIAWHPEINRIGEQFLSTTQASVIDINRFHPLFKRGNAEALPVAYSGISRNPVRIVRNENNAITITPSNSQMVVEVNGEKIHQAITLSKEQIDGGLILGLGRAVIFCLHWMRCPPKQNHVHGFLGVGEAAVRSRDLIRQAAKTDNTVLLLGETGTGKEIAAQAIHALSNRSTRPLATVNMAALNDSFAAIDLFGVVKDVYPELHATRVGLFCEAANSTLFLDDISNTPNTIQPLLLRVLESGEYRPLGAQIDNQSTARLIAAADQSVYDIDFNQALLRRLENFVIKLQPLRERREDIGLLMANIIDNNTENAVPASSIPSNLITQLMIYDWPGNVRQLIHVFNRVLFAFKNEDTTGLNTIINISPRDDKKSSNQFVIAPTDDATLKILIAKANNQFKSQNTEVLAKIEAKVGTARVKLAKLSEKDILKAMEKNAWTIQYAAQDLGISRPSMYKLLDNHSQIRRAEQIPAEELSKAISDCKGEVELCASLLKTPNEALRRHLKGLGLLS